MGNIIMSGKEARELLKTGIDKLANAVKSTLGPKGRNVILSKKYGSPLITNDGVSIAKEINLDDPCENIGAQIIKEASIKTNDNAGDGTSTSTVLAQAMVSEGFKHLDNGANPVLIRQGIEEAVVVVEKFIDKLTTPVSTKEEIAKVASLSAADENIGMLIAETMEVIGKEGIITIEESKSIKTEVVVVDGLRFDNGYISPYMVSDSQKMEAVLSTPYVLIVDKKIYNVQELVPALEIAISANAPILIIAEDIEGEALQTIVMNKIRGSIDCVAVKSPGYGELKKDELGDIAALTGAVIFSDETGYSLDEVTEEMLGAVESAVITKDHTTLVNGCGDKEAIQERIAGIKAALNNDITEFESNKLKSRIAKLTGGVAVIKVGAPTETEMMERKLRIEDALNATRAAVECGVVPGGGASYIKAASSIANKATTDNEKGIGYDIVMKSLYAPFNQILENAGIEEPEAIDLIKGNKGKTYDALNRKVVDSLKSGIIDPAKVTKSALRNAASVASTLLTTDSVVVEVQ